MNYQPNIHRVKLQHPAPFNLGGCVVSFHTRDRESDMESGQTLLPPAEVVHVNQ